MTNLRFAACKRCVDSLCRHLPAASWRASLATFSVIGLALIADLLLWASMGFSVIFGDGKAFLATVWWMPLCVWGFLSVIYALAEPP